MPGEQRVARLLAQPGIADQHGHDVALGRHHRNPGLPEPASQGRRAFLVALAQGLIGLQVADAGKRPGRDRRGQGGREDEARRVAAHHVDQRRRGGDIAAHHAEGLGQRPLDHGEPVHDPFAFGDAGAARAVHADGVNLVQVGHGAVAFGNLADLSDRRYVALHRIDRFERHQLGPLGLGLGEQPVEIGHVVVAEDLLFPPALEDALDHRGVIEGVGEDHRAGHEPGQRRERRLVGGVARGEQQRRLLVMQAGQLAFQQHVVVVGAGDVAGAAGAGAAFAKRLGHGVQNHRVLAHSQVVVRAPDGDFLGPVLAIAGRLGERPGVALQVGEDAVAILRLDRLDGIAEEGLKVHGMPLLVLGS